MRIKLFNFLRIEPPALRARWYRIHAWLKRHRIKKNIGINTYIDHTVQVLRWSCTRVGKNTIISENSLININHCFDGRPSLTIGDFCFIGRRNFFTTGESIEVKNYCMTGVDCHFLGSGHILSNPFIPYISSGTTNNNRIVIGANCWLGASVTVLGNVSIGHGSIIGANSLVMSNIPPFSVAIGNPAKVVKRFDVEFGQWVNVNDFSASAEEHIPTESVYLKMLEENVPTIAMPFRAAGKSMGDLF